MFDQIGLDLRTENGTWITRGPCKESYFLKYFCKYRVYTYALKKFYFRAIKNSTVCVTYEFYINMVLRADAIMKVNFYEYKRFIIAFFNCYRVKFLKVLFLFLVVEFVKQCFFNSFDPILFNLHCIRNR